MSELKHQLMLNNERSWVPCYLKEDVDEVIKELKKACNDKDDWCLHTLQENRHHKYKRCVAMAGKCESDMEQWVEGSLRWYRRKNWCKRWLELAEKFKEATR